MHSAPVTTKKAATGAPKITPQNALERTIMRRTGFFGRRLYLHPRKLYVL